MPESQDLRFALRPSAIDGTGCFALTPFSMGEFIMKYAGEKITPDEAERRRVRQEKRCICFIGQKFAIDGAVGGNESRYINHSCTPNCLVVTENGALHIYALKDISPGNELTADYYFELQTSGTICSCGSADCAGRLGRVGRFNFLYSRY